MHDQGFNKIQFFSTINYINIFLHFFSINIKTSTSNDIPPYGEKSYDLLPACLAMHDGVQCVSPNNHS